MLVPELCRQELVLLLPDLGQLLPRLLQLAFLPKHLFLCSNDLGTEGHNPAQRAYVLGMEGREDSAGQMTAPGGVPQSGSPGRCPRPSSPLPPLSHSPGLQMPQPSGPPSLGYQRPASPRFRQPVQGKWQQSSGAAWLSHCLNSLLEISTSGGWVKTVKSRGSESGQGSSPEAASLPQSPGQP